jgi:hypothetical protein
MFSEEMTGEPGDNQYTPKVHDNIMHRKAEQGTSLTYALKRLKKEKPITGWKCPLTP